MPSRIVLIGPTDALPSLQQRLDPDAKVKTFSDSEAIEALDYIIRHKPTLIAMHGEFAATSRGSALTDRIKDDPNLAGCEVRVLARSGSQSRIAAKRSGTVAAAAAISEAPAPPAALDVRGTRRAPRIRIKDGVEVAVDGNPAALVDLSPVGAQVISATVLKPNQRVRLSMGEGKNAVKCRGAVAWAAFEMPKGMPTRYRAGIDFGANADIDGVNGFAKKHKKDEK